MNTHNGNGYALVTACLFGLIAILQTVRAALQVPVLVGTHEVPVWASAIAAAVTAILCIWAIRTALHTRT